MGWQFTRSVHDAIVADVDYKNKGCPFCRTKSNGRSPPMVPHKSSCLLLVIIRRVDDVISEYAGKRVKL